MSYGSSLSLCRPVTTQTTSTPKPVYPSGSTLKSARCCDTGRPVMVDPISGRTICSCQLKPSASAYLSRVPGLPDAVYSSGSSHVFQPNVVIGNDPTSALYSMGLKADRSPDGGPPAPSSGPAPYYLEHLMATHPYSAYYPGFDFNNARRKNATRETTSALKAWLYEHRKNPYPTKGEKIMLAIITRMTLTQVSTWFANARRRLKKENKIDDKDDSLCEIDLQDKDDECHINCDISSGEEETDNSKHPTDLSDISDTEEHCLWKTVPNPSANRLIKPEDRLGMFKDYQRTSELSETKRHISNYVTDLPSASCTITPEDKSSSDKKESPDQKTSQNEAAEPTRPKIWSISEIISSSKASSSG